GVQLLCLAALNGGELPRPGIGAIPIDAPRADAGDDGASRRRCVGAMLVERQRIDCLGVGLVAMLVEPSRKLAIARAIALVEQALRLDRTQQQLVREA